MSEEKVEETAGSEQSETENVMSEEELTAQRKLMLKFYKEETPLLKVRAEYEKLITQIEEARFARLQIKMAHAQMMAPPEEEPSKAPRTLKADKDV